MLFCTISQFPFKRGLGVQSAKSISSSIKFFSSILISYKYAQQNNPTINWKIKLCSSLLCILVSEMQMLIRRSRALAISQLLEDVSSFRFGGGGGGWGGMEEFPSVNGPRTLNALKRYFLHFEGIPSKCFEGIPSKLFFLIILVCFIKTIVLKKHIKLFKKNQASMGSALTGKLAFSDSTFFLSTYRHAWYWFVWKLGRVYNNTCTTTGG